MGSWVHAGVHGFRPTPRSSGSDKLGFDRKTRDGLQTKAMTDGSKVWKRGETLSALRARVRAGSTGLISAGLCICVLAATARRRGNQYDPKYGSWGYI